MSKISGTRKYTTCIPVFDNSIDLPTKWDTDANTVNVDETLLNTCNRRITQQRKFDSKPLGTGICYGCGHMLWSSVDSAHTCLINKPSNMTKETSPAAAYLKAVPNCRASFVYKESAGDSKKPRWYACNYCRSASVPADQVFDTINAINATPITLNVKPHEHWDMNFPQQIQALTNQYERGQTAICGLFSSTVRQAAMSQYRHVQGEINAIAKLDRHYYGLFGFFALKNSDIWTHSPNPQSTLRIRNAIRWMHANNHLYSTFFAHYETLLRYCKPSFINPTLLETQNISLQHLLEDEAVGMAFPLDANYLENFPSLRKDWSEDVAGRQCPIPKSHTNLQDLCQAKYGEKYLDCKAFPHLHPWDMEVGFTIVPSQLIHT